MLIGLVSNSVYQEINGQTLEKIAEALEFQLHAHYAKMWQSDGVKVRVFSSLDELNLRPEVSPLIVFDDADQADALGYHSVDPQGKAYGRAFWKVLRDVGATLTEGPVSLSVTLSHESLEMVGNPYVNFWTDLPEGDQEALELCDRVQGDCYSVFGVSVSNFLGPRAFRSGVGPYDWMNVLGSPFEIRPNGYAIRRGKDGVIYSEFDEGVPGWKRDLVMKSKTSRFSKRKGRK